MKFKTTKKAMRENYNQIIAISYCGAQYLLKHTEPIAYSTRAEGWACDYYDVNGVLISTGYAPLVNKNTESTYDLIDKYENEARTVALDYSLTYEQQTEQIRALLADYVKEATK